LVPAPAGLVFLGWFPDRLFGDVRLSGWGSASTDPICCCGRTGRLSSPTKTSYSSELSMAFAKASAPSTSRFQDSVNPPCPETVSSRARTPELYSTFVILLQSSSPISMPLRVGLAVSSRWSVSISLVRRLDRTASAVQTPPRKFSLFRSVPEMASRIPSSRSSAPP